MLESPALPVFFFILPSFPSGFEMIESSRTDPSDQVHRRVNVRHGIIELDASKSDKVNDYNGDNVVIIFLLLLLLLLFFCCFCSVAVAVKHGRFSFVCVR